RSTFLRQARRTSPNPRELAGLGGPGRAGPDRCRMRASYAAAVALSPAVHYGGVRMVRTLAMLTAFLGAKLGANSARQGATLSHARPESPQVKPVHGDARPRLATG